MWEREKTRGVWERRGGRGERANTFKTALLSWQCSLWIRRPDFHPCTDFLRIARVAWCYFPGGRHSSLLSSLDGWFARCTWKNELARLSLDWLSTYLSTLRVFYDRVWVHPVVIGYNVGWIFEISINLDHKIWRLGTSTESRSPPLCLEQGIRCRTIIEFDLISRLHLRIGARLWEHFKVEHFGICEHLRYLFQLSSQ